MTASAGNSCPASPTSPPSPAASSRPRGLSRSPASDSASALSDGHEGRLEDCYRVYQVLQLGPRLVAELGRMADEQPDAAASIRALLSEPLNVHLTMPISVPKRSPKSGCGDLKEAVAAMGKFAELVETTVDIERIQKEREFRIRPDFDPNLHELHEKSFPSLFIVMISLSWWLGRLEQAESEMNQELQSMARKLQLEPGKTVKLEISGSSGPCFKVPLIRPSRSSNADQG